MKIRAWRQRIIVIWALAVSSLIGQNVNAHDLSTSYTEVSITSSDNRLLLTLMLDQADLNRIFDLDVNANRGEQASQIEHHLDEITSYLGDRIFVEIAGEKIVLAPGKATVEDDGLGNLFAKVAFHGDVPRKPWQVTVRLEIFDKLTPLHKNLLKVTYDAELRQGILTRGHRTETIFFQGDKGFLLAQILQFTKLGIEHIFVGYDHILFLLGLILIGGRIANVVKIVTAFTVAHSITLILAALRFVTVPSRIVESVIALSIVYIAVENFFVQESDQRWLISFAFGLMHGFGFANVLRELGLPPRGLIASLLSFNVGVEIGQLVIVLLTFPCVLFVLKTRWRKQFIYATSTCILIFGAAWFVERAFDFNIAFV